MNLQDPMFTKLLEKEGCQWIGPDQDPMIHSPITKCGCQVVAGKAYCGEHYRKMYIGGSALTKGRSATRVVKKQQTDVDWAELLWECYEELVAEGEIEP